MTETQEELAIEVRGLQKEVDRLNAQLKEKRFGLTWIDVPEAFEQESENKITVLEEVPELAIHNKDGKPTLTRHIILAATVSVIKTRDFWKNIQMVLQSPRTILFAIVRGCHSWKKESDLLFNYLKMMELCLLA